MKALLPLALTATLLLTGCIAPARFMPYVGEQEDWPVSKGAYAKGILGIQVYQGPPPKPYIVLGRVSGSGPIEHTREVMRGMVEETQRRGGQAILLENHETFSTGSVTFGGGSTTFGSADATIIGNTVMASGQSHTFQQPSVNVPTMGISLSGKVIRFTGEIPEVPEDESYRQNKPTTALTPAPQRK